MASKVLVSMPGVPFSQIQVKESRSGELVTNSLILGSQDYAFRVSHLEHSIKFLQEQHQLMLSGLHKEIESLRERNRDLQFQLIFNKDCSPKTDPTSSEDKSEKSAKEIRLGNEAAQLSREAAGARGEARAAEARALQLQQLLDAQIEKVRALELRPCPGCGAAEGSAGGAQAESPAELRARLADAERLVRRLRTDADQQQREVLTGGVTNLLFDDAAAHRAHVRRRPREFTAHHAPVETMRTEPGRLRYLRRLAIRCSTTYYITTMRAIQR